MSHDTPLAVLAGAATAAAALLGLDQFPDELPGWLGFLILLLGAGMLIGQLVGRTVDEFGPTRPKDRRGRTRKWADLGTTVGGLLAALIYVVVALVVLIF
jgi:hypothetical protein